METIERVGVALVDVQRACAQGVLNSRRLAIAPFHEFRLAFDHRGGRCPYRPLPTIRDMRASRPFEAGTAYPDAVSHRLATFADMVQVPVRGIDDDGSRGFGRGIVDHLAMVVRIQTLEVCGRNRKPFFRNGAVHMQECIGKLAFRRHSLRRCGGAGDGRASGQGKGAKASCRGEDGSAIQESMDCHCISCCCRCRHRVTAVAWGARSSGAALDEGGEGVSGPISSARQTRKPESRPPSGYLMRAA